MVIESGWKATSEVLDGEVRPVRGGWDCVGSGRTLFVPASMATDPTSALLLCRQGGLVTEKLNRMDPDRPGLST